MASATEELTRRIVADEPCGFIKYGDGEYFAAIQYPGHNCDGTPYSPALGAKIVESFRFLSAQPHLMLGAWHDPAKAAYWNPLSASPPNWVDYHTAIIDNLARPEKARLYKAIKESPRHKVYVANAEMHKAAPLLNLQMHIVVHPSNWFDTAYDDTLSAVCASIDGAGSDAMLITSAGMGAKPLIADVIKKYPGTIVIDVGSALDTICTKRDTRGFGHAHGIYHDQLCEYLREIVPQNWGEL
jgi:hypothetical protein